jgi:hypothetical protein
LRMEFDGQDFGPQAGIPLFAVPFDLGQLGHNET